MIIACAQIKKTAKPRVNSMKSYIELELRRVRLRGYLKNETCRAKLHVLFTKRFINHRESHTFGRVLRCIGRRSRI
jgi:hypothetical protein